MGGHAPGFGSRQRGTILVVAIILLLVMTLVTLGAVNVALSEQRASAADVRQKTVAQIAEAGIGEAVQHLRLRSATLLPKARSSVDAALWVPCGYDDTTFPCGAEPDPARRARMYRFIGGIDQDGAGGIDALEAGMLPYVQRIPYVAGLDTTQFALSYGVGALLCRHDAADPTGCTSDAGRTTSLAAITLVSRARIPGESAAATVTQTQVAYTPIDIPPHAPALAASGKIRGLGATTLVSNPHAGGRDVPVAMWTPRDAESGSGAWRSCALADFQRGGVPIESAHGVTYCASCSCPAGAVVSSRSGEGADVLDVDGAPSDSSYFPCDLFEYVFGFRSRRDADGDGRCETQVDADGNGTPDVVEKFLAPLFDDVPCDAIGASSSGLKWVRSDCTLHDAGSPDAPLVLVVDGKLELAAGSRQFGVFYLRDPNAVLGAATGLVARRDARLFGAALLEGDAAVEGEGTIAFNAQVLAIIDDDPRINPPRFGALPGSWTDRQSY